MYRLSGVADFPKNLVPNPGLIRKGKIAAAFPAYVFPGQFNGGFIGFHQVYAGKPFL
jgi:hypothetical protein